MVTTITVVAVTKWYCLHNNSGLLRGYINKAFCWSNKVIFPVMAKSFLEYFGGLVGRQIGDR